MVSFLYHDIVPANGILNPYRITESLFENHVSKLLSVTGKPATLIGSKTPDLQDSAYTFTFDDGHISAIKTAAPILEKHGSKGHFFIITSNIGKPGFLSENDIKELRKRGHIIGSHGHSHNPLKNKDKNEWLKSVEILTEILNEKIACASVPGGWYSKQVALAAANAGIEWLFNSEPTVNIYKEGNCSVMGRFSVSHKTTEMQLVNLLYKRFPALERQLLYWNIKKAAKTIGGSAYLKLRNWYFAGNSHK